MLPEMAVLCDAAKNLKSIAVRISCEGPLAHKEIPDLDAAAIHQVFNNLMNGFCTHLRAIVSMFNSRAGVTYQPQYFSAKSYQAIINANTGKWCQRGQDTRLQ
jgi:hypothetical protein